MPGTVDGLRPPEDEEHREERQKPVEEDGQCLHGVRSVCAAEARKTLRGGEEEEVGGSCRCRIAGSEQPDERGQAKRHGNSTNGSRGDGDGCWSFGGCTKPGGEWNH